MQGGISVRHLPHDVNLSGDLLTKGSIVVADAENYGSVEGVLLPHLDNHARMQPESLEERHDVWVG